MSPWAMLETLERPTRPEGDPERFLGSGFSRVRVDLVRLDATFFSLREPDRLGDPGDWSR